ncbi:MAG: tripartite tricarboxylate transporter permease [Sphaerochaetaceae bacterium]|nr:tripartite tricarboxylate transporter permease [Sphaerochaetaceae bacterium]
MDFFMQGLSQVANIQTILWMAIGSVLGIILGALPGLTATMGIALVMPISFHLPTATGMGLLLAVYCGAVSGASIPAILLGIPGNPNAIATVEDGLKMTKKGKAGQALGGAVVASFIGGIGSLLCLVFFSPLIAKATLAFGPAEKTTLALVGLVIIASVSGKSVLKGLFMGALGMALSLIGTDSFSGALRIPFASILGHTPLTKGLDLTSSLIGLYGISQVLLSAEHLTKPAAEIPDVKIDHIFPSFRKVCSMWKIILASLGIGTIIGAIPGTGASIAVFMAHDTARTITNASNGKLEELGTGCLEGVFAPEVANNAVTGGALIPALSLGIPGDSATAVLIGALMVKGVNPGFQLFSQNMSLVYAIFITMFIANLFMAVFQLAGVRLYPKILKVPEKILMPLVLMLSFIGAYAIAGQATSVGIFNMGVALAMGILGYFCKKNGYPFSPLVLGLILGSMFEENFRRAVKLAGGNYMTFFTKPICIVFIAFAVFSVVFPIIRSRKKASK